MSCIIDYYKKTKTLKNYHKNDNWNKVKMKYKVIKKRKSKKKTWKNTSPN